MKCQALYLGAVLLRVEINFNIKLQDAEVQMWKQKAGSILNLRHEARRMLREIRLIKVHGI